MKPTLKAGEKTTRSVTIDKERTIAFLGEEGRVFATPRILSDIEYTCRDFALHYLDPGEDTVGTRVQMEHKAAGLLGSRVDVDVTIAAVEGRRITFEAVVRDKLETIAVCTHERFVVDVEKVKARVAEKKKRLAGG